MNISKKMDPKLARRWWVIALAVFALGSGIFLAWRESQHQPPTLILVGMDALTWDVAGPLLREGRLPHFQALIQKGTHGPLKTLRSTYISAAIWTTILTGKLPKQHGIKGFFTTQGYAVNSSHRKTKFLPQLLSENGISTAAIGFWATWPAEKIKGWIVSDLASYGRFKDINDSAAQTLRDYSYLKKIPGVTWPEGLVEEILPVMLAPHQVPRPTYEAVLPMSDPEWEAFSRLETLNREDELSLLKFSIVTDLNFHRAGMEILRRHYPRAYLVYFEGPDIVGHFFWKYMEPEFFPEVNPVDAVRYGEVIRNYYIFMDHLLGEIMSHAGEQTLIVVLSDHGMKRVDFLGQDGLHSGEHRLSKPPGVIIMSGPGIKAQPEKMVEGAVVVDVVPTLLYLLGLPVGKDMNGKVWLDAITPEFQAAHPVTMIPSHDHNLKTKSEVITPLNEEIKKRLRGLGYLE